MLSGGWLKRFRKEGYGELGIGVLGIGYSEAGSLWRARPRHWEFVVYAEFFSPIIKDCTDLPAGRQVTRIIRFQLSTVR
jgi:hypothetical protein